MTVPIFIALWLLSGLIGAAIWFYFQRDFRFDESMSICTVCGNCLAGPISLFLAVGFSLIDYFAYTYNGCGKTIFRKKVK